MARPLVGDLVMAVLSACYARADGHGLKGGHPVPDEFMAGAHMHHDRLAMLARMGVGGDAIMLLIDPETLALVEVSPAAERFYGWERDEFVGLRVTDLNPIGEDQVRSRVTAVLDGGVHVHEMRHQTRSGELRDVEIHARPITVGEKDFVVATIFDLSHPQRVMRALAASEQRYRRLVELTPDALFVEVHGLFAYVNPATVRLLGAETASQLLGREILGFVHPECQDAVKASMDRTHRGKPGFAPVRRKYVRLDGETVEVEVSGVAIEYGGEAGAQILARDITARARAEAVMAWNAAIVESSDDAIYSEDVEGYVLNWNRGAERLYGYTADEIVGRCVYDTLIPEDLAEENRQRLARMWLEDRPEHFETTRLRDDSTRIEVAITLSPIHNEQGLVIGISAIGHDISERKQLELAKDEFLSLVSHELRTPLTTIFGYAQLLADRERDFPPERRAQVGEKLLARSGDMLTLVEELLDATRLHSGELQMQMHHVDPMQLLTGLAESFPDGDRRRLRLVTDHGTQPLACDARWMSVAVGNLISNALKFSPATEPVLVEVSEDGGATCFNVHDNGPGVDPAVSDKLFDRFVQGDMSSTRTHQGAGLGLYIARRIVEMHGGTIAVMPRAGGGSTFTIALPAA